MIEEIFTKFNFSDQQKELIDSELKELYNSPLGVGWIDAIQKLISKVKSQINSTGKSEIMCLHDSLKPEDVLIKEIKALPLKN